MEECLIRPSSSQDNTLLDFFLGKKVQLGMVLPVSTHVCLRTFIALYYKQFCRKWKRYIPKSQKFSNKKSTSVVKMIIELQGKKRINNKYAVKNEWTNKLMHLSRLRLWLDSAIFNFRNSFQTHTQNITEFSLTFSLFPFKSRVLIL